MFQAEFDRIQSRYRAEMPVLMKANPENPPFRLVEIPTGQRAAA